MNNKTLQILNQKKLMELLIQNNLDIYSLYNYLINNLTDDLKGNGTKKINDNIMNSLQNKVDLQKVDLGKSLNELMNDNLQKSASITTDLHKDLLVNYFKGSNKVNKSTINLLFDEASELAVETAKNKRINGLNISQRIWNTSQSYRNIMNDLIEKATEEQMSCVDLARALEGYVKSGSRTLTQNYPNMMSRMKYVPQNLSYEALRLARTELTSVFSDSTKFTAERMPLGNGIKFAISNTHPQEDICDDICSTDKYNLGKGVYPINKAPDHPFHPNCLCCSSVELPPIEEMGDRIKNWIDNPDSETEIEKWYNGNILKNKPPSTNKVISKEKQNETNDENTGIESKIQKISTYKDLKKYVINNWDVKKVALSKLDFNMIKDTFIEMDKVINKYPKLKGAISEIGQTFDECFMQFTPSKNKLEFNFHYYTNRTYLEDTYKRSVDVLYHPKNTTWKDTGIHELGHVLEGILANNMQKNTNLPLNKIWNNNYISGSIIDKAYSKYKQMNKNDNIDIAIKNISHYSNESDAECLAEAFCDYMVNGNNSSDFSKSIVEELEEELKKVK